MPAVIVTAALISGGAALATGFLVGGAVAWAAVASAAVTGAITAGVSYLLAGRPKVTAQAGARNQVRAPVTNARYVLGTTRCAGHLVFIALRPGDETKLDMALALSDGAVGGINAMWVDGEQIKHDAGTPGSDRITYEGKGEYAGKLTATLYNTPDQVTNLGDTLQAVNPLWSSKHLLRDISWVHLELTQDKVENLEDRVWKNIPQVQFLLQGKTLTWPGQAIPTHTRNAAAIRYWYETEINGNAVDRASFDAAFNVCAAVVDTRRADGSVHSAPRYLVDGVITSGDSRSAVEFELDQAWQGSVIYIGGVAHFRPGVLRAPVATVTQDDVIQLERIQPAPALQDRLNSVSLGLAQCDTADHTEFRIPTVRDDELVARDGVERHADLGVRAYVSSAVAGARIAALALRRARQSAHYTYRLFARKDMSLMGVYPGDIVTVTDALSGLSGARCAVTRSTVHADWTVSLELTPEPASTWDDIVIEGIPPSGADRPTVAITGLSDTVSGVSPVDLTFTWSEDVIGFAASDITVAGGVLGALSGSGDTYTAQLTPTRGEDARVAVAAGAAENATGDTGPMAIVAVTATWVSPPGPTLKITGMPASVTDKSVITLTFTWSEPVLGFQRNDINLYNPGYTAGATAAYGAFGGSGSVYTLDIVPTLVAGLGPYVSVAADTVTNLNGDPGPPLRVIATSGFADTTKPTLAISGMPANVVDQSPLSLTFTWSEDVIGFTASDITVTGGALSAFTGSGTTYTATVTPDPSIDVSVTVRANTVSDPF